MRFTIPRRARILTTTIFLAAVTASGFGCGDEESPMAPVDNGPSMERITVTLSSALIVASCENDPTNPGDFTYELFVVDSTQDEEDYLHFEGSLSGRAGETDDFDDIVFTMEREPKSGDWFQMEFHVTEWDTDGQYDPRMRGSIGYITHRYEDDNWNEGPHAATASGSSECRVSFIYAVDVK